MAASAGSALGPRATLRCGFSLHSAMLPLQRQRAARCGLQRRFWCRCVTTMLAMLGWGLGLQRHALRAAFCNATSTLRTVLFTFPAHHHLV